VLGHAWRKFLNGETKELMKFSLIETFRDILKLIFDRKYRVQQRRKLQIEDALSRKHDKAIKVFVEKGSVGDTLLVLESDAVFSSREYFEECLSGMLRVSKSYDFSLFASPFKPDELCLNEKEWEEALKNQSKDKEFKSFNLVKFPRLTTNTAVCFAIPYTLATMFLSKSKNRRRRLYLPSDFHLNMVFRSASITENVFPASTIMFLPAPVSNGSLDGNYDSELSRIPNKTRKS